MLLRSRLWVAGCLCVLSTSAWADDESISLDGINSRILKSAPYNLTGAGIAIGQVEIGRPGVPGIDDPNTHEDVVPTAVFLQNGSADPADATVPHALQVASVMISKGAGNLAGVATDALLYASAFGAESLPPEDLMKTIQHVASRNGGDIRAINHSYGVFPGGLESPDGNSYLTLGLDWSAAAHNVLHVVSGEDFEANPLPADNYNGITVAMSRRDTSGVFREVDPDINNYIDAINAGRVWIDLLAPGRDIDVAGFNSTTVNDEDGTSYAAPHVTGTVALLQEFANDKVMNVGGIHWGNTFHSGPANYTAQRHEVMKAVLLNSADKVFGAQSSSRDVVRQNGDSWFDTTAGFDPEISLDLEFGAGHLNAKRALTQFENGEWEPFAPVPSIGWDFGETGGPGTTLRYPFEHGLFPGEYIGVTLTWDRFVDKTGSSTSFSPGDIFFGAGLNDLDVYLMPEGWVDFSQAITGLFSVSSDDNVEHFFGQIPSAGNYEIVVNHFPGGLETDQHFALAW